MSLPRLPCCLSHITRCCVARTLAPPRSVFSTRSAYFHSLAHSFLSRSCSRPSALSSAARRLDTSLASGVSASSTCFGASSIAVRHLFIQTQSTPNPNALKFLPGQEVLPVDAGTVDFPSYRTASGRSPLATMLFAIDGVCGVLLSHEFISVNVTAGSDWNVIKPSVYACIMDFYASNQPVLTPQSSSSSSHHSTSSSNSTVISSDDSEVVAMIKELIDTRIRPSVQEDGGDIQFISFDEATGKVMVAMQGSCKGCSSSSVTLKHGIENMLMHYVPEVQSVEQVEDELETVSNQQLKTLEEGLAKANHSHATPTSHTPQSTSSSATAATTAT